MQKEYTLCFIFQKLCFSQSGGSSSLLSFSYKIELFKNQLFVEKIELPLKLGSSGEESNIDDCYLEVKISEKELINNPRGEIRLFKTNYNIDQLIGSYGFAFTNHIHPYQQINRKSIQLSIEIAANYTLEYQVIVESSPLALQQLRKEHLYAQKLSFIERADSQKADFLPEELFTRHRRQSFKTIQLFESSESVTLKTRFWSPEKERNKQSFSCEIFRSKTDGAEVQYHPKQGDKSPSDSLGSMKLKFRRRGSLCSSVSQKEGFPIMNQSTLDEWQTESFIDGNHLQEEHLYEVIKNNSKIIIPEVTNSPKKEGVVDCADIKDQSDFSLGNMDQVGSSSFGLKIVLLIAILLLAGLGINLMSKSLKKKVDSSSIHKRKV